MGQSEMTGPRFLITVTTFVSARLLRAFRALAEPGHAHVDCGLVSIGPEAERLWGGRNYMELLSVFDTPELFTVMSGSRELGVLHELSFRRKDAIVLLGGRSWRVSAIDPKRRIAHVEPADDQQGRSTWLGSSQGLS